MAKLVDKTYGDALFELALESGKTDELSEEAEGILNVFSSNEELVKFLVHPKITKEEKKEAVTGIFKNRVSDDMTGFLLLTIEKDRQKFIPDILKYFISRIKEYQKTGIAYVTTAVPLDDEKKKEICDRLIATTEYERFEMNYCTDSSIIGGMIIRIGDRVVDSSIRTRIEEMSKELYDIQITTM